MAPIRHNTEEDSRRHQQENTADINRRIGGREDLFSYRNELAQGAEESLNVSFESSTSTPERLMAMYLSGKLSQGELVYKLKAYNMVTADNLIREAKHCPTTPIDYVEVPQASVDPITHEQDKPLQGASGNKSEEDAGKGLQPSRDEYTKEKEQENLEEEQQQLQEEETQQVIQNEEAEQLNRQSVQAHQRHEKLRKEEEEREGSFSSSLEDGVGVGERSKKGALDSAQRRLKGAKRHIEEQKRQKLLMLAQSIAREGRSEDERLEEEELLMSLLDDWELLSEATGAIRIPVEDGE